MGVLCICSPAPTYTLPFRSPGTDQGQAGTLAPVAKKETAYGRQGLHLLQLLPPTWAPVLMASGSSINTAHAAMPPCLYMVSSSRMPSLLPDFSILRFSSSTVSSTNPPLVLSLPPVSTLPPLLSGTPLPCFDDNSTK